jgi:hypothetical protein
MTSIAASIKNKNKELIVILGLKYKEPSYFIFKIIMGGLQSIS